MIETVADASDVIGNDTFSKLLAVCTAQGGDAATVEAAASHARSWGASLSLMVAVEPPPEIDRIAAATGVAAAEIEARLIRDHHDRAVGLAEQFAADLDPTVAVRLGKPFLEVIRYVVAGDVDLVIKAAEELSGIHHYFFTSTDQHLLRKCPCPVWLRLDHDGSRPIRTILAAVDIGQSLSGEPETIASLNRNILSVATRFGAAEGADVHVLHVWDAPSEGLVRMWSGGPDPDKAAEDYVSDVRTGHILALDRLIGQANAAGGPASGRAVQFLPRLERGDARSVVPQQVQALEADLLVMGTIARTGVPGFFIGNTAEDVLNSVDCSVVTVKPSDYVSPVIAGG
ncbi:universal stress protein [Bauldia sp.]|uniref:universal stress protein n=1 Tax=Bauldia sp. TaxID=2575872 RepID=UPI003BA9ABC3